MDLRFREECYGYSGGQTDCSLYALAGDEVAGKIDIAYHKSNGRREAYIKMIEVKPEFRGKGMGKALIYRLASEVPYDSIDWGSMTPDGAALKSVMDKEFGTSYKAPPPKPEYDDPKYDSDLNGDLYLADLKAWETAMGYIQESIYLGKAHKMKVKELKKMVMESVTKTMQEAGYDQYGESMAQPTDPSWFDTLMAPDEAPPEMKNTPEARALVDAAKRLLKKFGPKIDKEVMNAVVGELEQDFQLPDGVSWEVVHAAYEEMKSDMLSGPTATKTFMSTEAFVDMVREMIKEEISNLRKGK